MNMSYCRFRNTSYDLSDCLDALADGDVLSEEENRAGEDMFKEFLEFCMDWGLISGYNESALEDFFLIRSEEEEEYEDEEEEEEEDD